jgi:hypothetical protein
MIKLSDYLNYLNQEVIQARISADKQAIETAKEYAKHEYLKHFSVPRYSLPVVKMNVPIKIQELDSETTYDFKRDYDAFVSEVNEKISEVNLEKGYRIEPIDKNEILENKEIIAVFDRLEKYDYSPVRSIEENLAKVDVDHLTKFFSPKLTFSAADDSLTRKEGKVVLARILKEALSKRFSPVKADLREIYIDPDTSREDDKGKILLTLDVEMVEDCIRIRNVRDEEGNEFEEIIFE